MKRSLTLVLAALFLTGGSSLSAQEKNDTKPVRPPAVELPPGGGVAPGFQPPGGGIGLPPGLPGMADHKELVATLVELLDDADTEVRQAAATALGKFGRQAVSPLMAILKDKDKSAALRANAAYALGHIGPQAQDALPELTKALKEKDKDLRKRAAFAVGNIVQSHGFGLPVGPIGGPGIGGIGAPMGVKPIDPGVIPPPGVPEKKD